MSSTTVTAPIPKTPFQEFVYYFSQNRGAVIGFIFILIVLFAAIFADWVAPFDNRTKPLILAFTTNVVCGGGFSLYFRHR
jgi:ABC-type antimicrobial peptide transport system permease subunit